MLNARARTGLICWQFLSLTLIAAHPASAQTDPFAIYQSQAIPLGSKSHLFIDEMSISHREGVRFVVNAPDIAGPALQNEHPWENWAAYSSILDDGTGEYKFYYMNTYRPEGEDNIALATSTDGVTWEKPSLGLVEYDGSTDNNIVIGGLPPHPGGTVLFDPRDPDPARRYKYLTAYNVDDKPDTLTAEGLVVYTSPDGIHFQKHDVQLAPFIHDSQAVLLWDPYIGKYTAYLRGSDEPLFPHGGRKVVRLETDDILKPWTYRLSEQPHYGGDHELPYFSNELPTVLRADADDPIETDLYNNQVTIYTRGHRVYLAFPTCYYHYRGERGYLSPTGGGNVGSGEVQLAVSRDGINWTRYRRPAYIKHGWNDGHYSGWPWVLHGMIFRGNRIYQYVNLRTKGHGVIPIVPDARDIHDGLLRVEQIIDRFVAAEFDYTGGRIVTDPILFEGNRLIVNVDTGAMGEATVGLLEPDGTSIRGYTTSDCDLINGDWIERVVSWRRGEKDVSAWAGRPIRLELKMRGARLYALRFESDCKR